jgi:hypothetical protein
MLYIEIPRFSCQKEKRKYKIKTGQHIKNVDDSIGFYLVKRLLYLIDGEHLLPWRRFPIIAPTLPTHFTLKRK